MLSPKRQQSVCLGIESKFIDSDESDSCGDGELGALIIARVMKPADTDLVISDLTEACSAETVCYVVMVGTKERYRRNGLASLLFRTLLYEYMAFFDVDRVLLHALAGKNVQFYRQLGFQSERLLPKYYFIGKAVYDGQLWSLPINRQIQEVRLAQQPTEPIIMHSTQKCIQTMTKTNQTDLILSQLEIRSAKTANFKAWACCIQMLLAFMYNLFKRLLLSAMPVAQYVQDLVISR